MIPVVCGIVPANVAFGTKSCASRAGDATASATTALSVLPESERAVQAAVLMSLAASSCGSTARVAKAIADEPGTMVVGTDRGDVLGSGDFVLVGFGSGVLDGKHQASLLALADELPPARGLKALIFSTCGIPASFASPGRLADHVDRDHATTREKPRAKGYEVVGEFGCPGFDDDKVLTLIGGLNRGRPNAEDLQRARSSEHQLVRLGGTER